MSDSFVLVSLVNTGKGERLQVKRKKIYKAKPPKAVRTMRAILGGFLENEVEDDKSCGKKCSVYSFFAEEDVNIAYTINNRITTTFPPYLSQKDMADSGSFGNVKWLLPATSLR